MTDQPEQPLEVQNFLKNWKPDGVTSMDQAHIEGHAALPVETKEETPAETITPEAKVEETKAEVPVAEATIESSLKDEKIEVPSTKGFEDLLTEKSAGKFKNWEEVEALINAEKPNPYADPIVEKINEYIKQGGTYEDYQRTQSIDFNTMSAKELMEYKIQMEDPDMTEEEVDYEMRKRFGIDKWKDKSDEYDEGVEPEEIRMAKLKFNRDAQKAKAELVDMQKQWAVPVKKEEVAQEVDPRVKEKWNSEVTAITNKFEKVPLKITETENYDFQVDATERVELAKTLSKLGEDYTSYFERFKNADGKGYDLGKIAEADFKARNFDKAVATAAREAYQRGKATIVKDELKNTSMKPEGTQVPTKVKSTEDYVKEQALKIARGEA